MDTDAVLALLQDVAEEIVNPRFRSLASHDISEKNPGDLVTVADREAEVRITTALHTAYPAAVILGEEATATDDTQMHRFLAADHAFTVDPVDGTKNFVHGSPDHAMMVAELRGGEVVRSWIWQPQHRTAYVAERGAGAFRNGERLVRPPAPEALRGVTSRRRWVGQALGQLPPLDLTWVCCGVDYPKLVEGEADYVVYRRPNPWDHAPGSLLLSEAGGYVGTFDGERYQPQGGLSSGLVPAADRATYELVQGLVDDLPGAVTPAVPGLPPDEQDPNAEQAFRLELDGELFEIRHSPRRGTYYAWLSGPNDGYGFVVSGQPEPTLDDHREAIRSFLAQVDPATGYLGD